MSAASEEPAGPPDGGGTPDTSGPPVEAAAQAKETCEQNKHQLESLREIMLKNKQSLKKKEEEVQEYARRLSKIKSRAKLSRRSKEPSDSPRDPSQASKPDPVAPEEAVDDISQARTPKAKSTLLQKKLAENRKAFEQRSKEITETKRAVEEKVEAMKQLLDEKDSEKMTAPVTPLRPVVVTSDIMSPIQLGGLQEKDNRIAELSGRILELEATVLDLQENLKEKDSVIESKTKAVMLMSADLSRKGKTTLDTLEDTKDEMRTMQEHFVLMESSLRNKNESLLEQLQERDNKISGLEDTVREYEHRMNEQKLAESAKADFTRTTMDTLVETKDAMRSIQENFVLMETSLKAKNDHLLDQLKDYEFRLAEANERIFQLESGAGIAKDPTKDDLMSKVERLERANRQLQDEKYELQKSLSEIQDRIARSVHGNGAIIEKDNRIAELENLIEELKQSNKLLEEESKAELQNQLAELTLRNEEYSNRVTDLEKLVHELEAQRIVVQEDPEGSKDDERVAKLTKELEDLNKSMIKVKAQHRSKVKNLQKQLENFKSVSDTNAELVRLGNQLALLEEEKGNLQLSLVDFDELKASSKDWQERVAELESRLQGQANEIQTHADAIAALENQKLELMQELHTAKQEISALEAENAESENLRVTAEMKVVDLEEQLESLTKSGRSNRSDLENRIEALTRENSDLYKKLNKLEEKGASDSGSTESFEAIHETEKPCDLPKTIDKSDDLAKRIDELTRMNEELTEKLSKLEEKGSTESFESINEVKEDRQELVRRIEQLTKVNTELTLKLNRLEEKGSSDTGSTESFERIPEQNESISKIELLTQENNELVIKLTKLEEQFERIEIARAAMGAGFRVENLLEANRNQSVELVRLRAQVTDLAEENSNLQWRVETLLRENNELIISRTKLEERFNLRNPEESLVRLPRDKEKELEESYGLEKAEESLVRLPRDTETKLEESHGLEKAEESLVRLPRDTETKLEERYGLEKAEESLVRLPRETEKELEESHGLEKAEESLVRLPRETEKELEESHGLEKAEESLVRLPRDKETKLEEAGDKVRLSRDTEDQVAVLLEEKDILQREMKELKDMFQDLKSNRPQDSEIEDLKDRIKELSDDNLGLLERIEEAQARNSRMAEELARVNQEKTDLEKRLDQVGFDDSGRERLELIERLEKLNLEKESVALERQQLQDQITSYLGQKPEEDLEQSKVEAVTLLEREIEDCKRLISEQTSVIEDLRLKLADKEMELQEKATLIEETSGENLQGLQDELKEMQRVIEEWRFKCNEMEERSQLLENGKATIEEGFRKLQQEYELLLEESNLRKVENEKLKDELGTSITSLEEKLRDEVERSSRKDQEVATLREMLKVKEEELQAKYSQLQNEMIVIDGLQDELQACKVTIQEKEANITLLSEEVERLKLTLRLVNEEEVQALNKEIEKLHRMLENSRSVEDYNELLEDNRTKDRILTELKVRLEETGNEREDLLTKVKELISRNQEVEDQVTLKEKSLAEAESEREYLKTRLELIEREKMEAERRISELQELLDNNNRFLDDLRTELSDSYSLMENLKEKHTEDTRMQSQRLETILEELSSKTEEVDRLRTELEEKEALIGLNVTQESKTALETRIAELEQKVSESEERIQAQLEKMKKIAANLKRKTALCQELEARLQELQERWNTEKDEKEAKNRKIQEVEALLRDRDSKMADLEERLGLVTNQNMEATSKMEKVTRDLLLSEEKVSSLTEQITEMEEEIINLRSQLDSRIEVMRALEDEKERLRGIYESLRSEVDEDKERKEAELEEVKERARELSVRMQVMESEYVEQLSVINNLRAEIGMLLSRQTQIQEKLENTEKESEERRMLLEKLQNVTTTTISTQTDQEEEARLVEGCERCEQCQTLVQALEAKLQEREAEIENLDNELANSIGNFVQMRESLRYSDLMNQTARNLEEPYNELLTRFNALTAGNEEVKRKLAETMREREELTLRVESLQGQNETLEEKVAAFSQVESESSKDLEQLTQESQTLKKTCQDQERMLAGLRTELENAQANLEQLLERERSLTKVKDSLELEVATLREENDSYSRRLADLDRELEVREGTGPRLERSVGAQEAVDVGDDAPRLFDASKIFGSPVLEEDEAESARLRGLVEEKEAQLVNLTLELRNLQGAIVEERSQMSQSYDTALARLKETEDLFNQARVELETLKVTLAEKDREVEDLRTELSGVKASSEAQRKKMNETEARLELLTAEKDSLIGSLKTELNSTRDNLEHLSRRHNQQIEELETYKIQIANLEAELRNLTDNELIQELEGRVSATLKERDLLQLQVNDLSRSLELLRSRVQGQTQESVEPKSGEVKDGMVQEAVQDLGSSWDVGSSERLNLEEEAWGWNPEEAQLAVQEQATGLSPSLEVLKAKVDDLQDQIKELKAEKEQLIEEGKVVQARSGKMVKKLKEYKVQVENLQQQLKIQKSAGDFYQLDSAIEEELRSQIGQLEKSLAEAREEQRRTMAEKDSLLKRLDVVVAANERYMEMKEWQDTDMEALRIQNKQLSGKIQNLEHQLQENATSGPRVERQVNVTSEVPVVQEVQEDSDQVMALTKRYKEEMDDLRDEMEALATENEQLQQFLEEQRAKLSSLEARNATDEMSHDQRVHDLTRQTSDLQSMLNKSREEYDQLRRQYEQSLMDANDQVSIMRQTVDLRNSEAQQKVSMLELEISKLRDQLEASDTKARNLEKSLQEALEERQDLEDKVFRLTLAEEKLSTSNASLAEVTELLNVRIQEVADLKQELQRQYVERQNMEVALNATVDGLTLELNEKRLELEDLRRSFTDKERELIEERSVETVSTIVSQATQELVQRHAIDLEERDNLIRGLNQRISSLEEELNRYIEEAKTWRDQLDSKEQEVRLLMDTLSQKESQLTELRSSLEVSEERLRFRESELARTMERLGFMESENQRHLEELEQLGRRLNESEANLVNAQEEDLRVLDLRTEVEALRTSLADKESKLAEKEFNLAEMESNLAKMESNLTEKESNLAEMESNLAEKESNLAKLESNLAEMESNLAEKELNLSKMESTLSEKESILAEESNLARQLELLRETEAQLEISRSEIQLLKEQVQNESDQRVFLTSELDRVRSELQESRRSLDRTARLNEESFKVKEESSIIDDLPLFRMPGPEEETIDNLKADLNAKTQEIEHLKYLLSENTYPGMIAEMQERIDGLYNEKTSLETSLRLANQALEGKQDELNQLRLDLTLADSQKVADRDKRSSNEQEEILRLQNELHSKQQEINELKYVIAEKESQLSVQEQPSDDLELQAVVDRLTGELYAKEQEIKRLESNITQLRLELEQVQGQRDEYRRLMEGLESEKEGIRLEAEMYLERILKEKEEEIDQIKQRLSFEIQQLSTENQRTLEELHLREADLENVKIRLEESTLNERRLSVRVHQVEEELQALNTDLAEKERRLAELSITKDTELHNLRVQIREKDSRIEELLTLSEEEEKQLHELRNSLESRETEINALKKLLEDKVTEYELIRSMKKDVPVVESSRTPGEGSSTDDKQSQELDLALYMLHQRDVRCEELTHELMQLLEERDTLQLRLSNAIRVNEELRRLANNPDSSPRRDAPGETEEEEQHPLVEHPSPGSSRSEGPVEIAREAIDAPIGEDKQALALKLSQLQTVGHSKDVRIRDERELRHTQQMSLLAHKDVLSQLPPEAAARIVNANYTLSRDVQSQSSVLLNWLWGRSTPKVVHM